MEESDKKCFVITPIGPANSSIRRKVDGLIDEVIEPVMKELKYKVEVSHRISESGTMTAAIIQRVYQSDLVIANLTGNNPNVMYEVALRHAAGKAIIHIAEDVSALPFDVNDQRTIQYTDDMSGAKELKQKLYEMVRNINLAVTVSNPIMDALTKQNLVNIPQEKSLELSDALLAIKSELSDLKKQVSYFQNKNGFSLWEPTSSTLCGTWGCTGNASASSCGGRVEPFGKKIVQTATERLEHCENRNRDFD